MNEKKVWRLESESGAMASSDIGIIKIDSQYFASLI